MHDRRRRVFIGAAFAVLVALAALPAAHHDTPPAQRSGALARPPGAHARQGRTNLPAVRWPQQGQAALAIGGGRTALSPNQQPVPIASLAKVMTAYLILQRYPLSGAQDGFTITVTAAQEQTEAQDDAEGGSVVAVRAGEQLTERQLLQALLIPSGNNIARMLATLAAGSETAFLTEMNAEARALGMAHTIYTDPSGLDPGTVSTAADQLRVFRQAMRFSVFREVVSTAGVTLPVAGTVRNFNPLIAEGYAGKTGSDSESGGCLAFFTRAMVGGRTQTAVGVVLGQGHGSDTSALLAAAGEAAKQLVDSAGLPSFTGSSPSAGSPPLTGSPTQAPRLRQ